MVGVDMVCNPGDIRKNSFYNAVGGGAAALEQRQLPACRLDVVPDQVDVPIAAAQLEIAVGRGDPPVEHISDDDAPVAEVEDARCFLAPVAGVALDLDGEER
jgi:hypothetical protein